MQPSVITTRCGSIAWKKTCSTRPVRRVRTVWKAARTQEPCTLTAQCTRSDELGGGQRSGFDGVRVMSARLEKGERNVSCSISRLRLKFFADSALYTPRCSPMKSASSP